MDLIQYLTASLLLIVMIGGWTFIHAIQRAIEGYQDELGFHFGPTPPAYSFFTSQASSLYDPPDSTEKPKAEKAKRRQSAGSKPPMLPEGMLVDDLNPQPARSLKRQAKSDSRPNPQSGQTQIPFANTDDSSDSA